MNWLVSHQTNSTGPAWSAKSRGPGGFEAGSTAEAAGCWGTPISPGLVVSLRSGHHPFGPTPQPSRAPGHTAEGPGGNKVVRARRPG